MPLGTVRSIPINSPPTRHRRPTTPFSRKLLTIIRRRSSTPVRQRRANLFAHCRECLSLGGVRPAPKSAAGSGRASRATLCSTSAAADGKSLRGAPADRRASARLGADADSGGPKRICPVRRRANLATGDDRSRRRPRRYKGPVGKATPHLCSQRGLCNLPGGHRSTDRHRRQADRPDQCRFLVSRSAESQRSEQGPCAELHGRRAPRHRCSGTPAVARQEATGGGVGRLQERAQSTRRANQGSVSGQRRPTILGGRAGGGPR